MERFAQVQSIADEYVRSVSAEIVRLDGNGLPVIDHQKLTAKKNWEYVLFRLLEPFGFTSSVVADLVSVLKSGGTVSGRTFVADEYLAVTSAKEISVFRIGNRDGNRQDGHFDKLSDRAAPFAEPAASVAEHVETTDITIEGPGTYSLNGVKFSVSLSDDVRNVRTVAGETKSDTAGIPFPFTVRHWKNGDWMRPLGMRGRKKLSDIFVDLKFSLTEKKKALVIADEGSHVLALVGHRIDDSVKVTKDTSSVTVIRLI